MSSPSSPGGPGADKAGGGKPAASGVSSVSGSDTAPPAAAGSLVPAGLSRLPAGLAALFECPVCSDSVLPPILQCQAGHLLCNLCRQKLSCCPTCRGPLTPSIRNLAMEKVASTLPFPCKVRPPVHSGSLRFTPVHSGSHAPEADQTQAHQTSQASSHQVNFRFNSELPVL
ncbi:unnamed protein product [Pleuronectes platessa]|uniref:RING-type E3 ubiquitin transferase SIAH2 n=1 Tax=Pleuronectes platessa TaxID=8262 RepID=A0A9N7URV5_PLEPL|nr:unnamed protein product [Pleuronectes platessa]